MREMNVSRIEAAVKQACREMAVYCSEDILKRLKQARDVEKDERSITAVEMLVENARIAEAEQIPLCQDTGMVTAYVHIGQEVHLIGGSLREAVMRGVSEGYTENYLRASVVRDPVFDRTNTRDNTPAVLYCDITEGEEVRIELTAKGFGSENMSRIAMLKPAEGLEGVRQFILETIHRAGPNACPPMIVGVGIGGTFDQSAVMAKHALLRNLDEENPDENYRALEKELEEKANEMGIGPMGLGGRTTVLRILIEHAPTHIAGLPCAVNICCHACRHREVIL